MKNTRLLAVVGLAAFTFFGVPMLLGASWDQVGVRPPLLVDPSGNPVAQKATATGAAKISSDGFGPTAVDGCMTVECSLVGDAGVVRATIPTDGGILYPQAATRYVATVTTASGVRVNNAACNGYQTGAGRLLNEGAVLDFTTPNNPDGGVGNLAMHCCSLVASSASAPALFQLCPQATP